MSIGEHLEELRRHVLKGLMWVGLALVVCLAFQKQLLLLAKRPHEQMVDALVAEARTEKSRQRLEAERVEAARAAVSRDDDLARQLEDVERAGLIAREKVRPTSAEALADLEARQARALERLAALQRRLEAAADADPADAARVVALEPDLVAARAEVELLRVEVARDVRPLLDAHANVPKAELVSLSPPDVFLTAIKLSLVAALFLAAPLLVWELWKFVSRALYPHERRWVRLFGPLSYGAFLTGFTFGYLILIPIGLRFLASYAPAEVAVTQYSVQGYMSLMITLSLVCGVIFELPLAMAFLALIGVMSADGFRRWRKYFVLAGFVVAGILTPPDPFTQTLMAIPLLGLYEVGILLAVLVGRRPPEEPTPALGDGGGYVEDEDPGAPLDDAGPPDVAPAFLEEDALPADLRPRPAPEGTISVGAAPEIAPVVSAPDSTSPTPDTAPGDDGPAGATPGDDAPTTPREGTHSS